MNPNSFPSGEEPLPDRQDIESADELLSFKDHMNQVEQDKENREGRGGNLIDRIKNIISNALHQRERVRHNMEELNKPTLKNTELLDGASFANRGVETVHNKLKNNEPLNGHDIMGMVSPGYDPEETELIFTEIGINSGRNFDVDLPKVLYNADGSEYTTPLTVSYEDVDGSFVQIGIGQADFGVTLYAARGGKAADVNYKGPFSIEDDPKVFKTAAFDYAGQTLVNVDTKN